MDSGNEGVLEKKMPEQGNLKSTIDMLDGKLNELYALDDSWRRIGKWPEGETGSILHPPASPDEIAEAEQKVGHEFPPSYQEFLRLHSAWEHFWGAHTLVGTSRPAVQRAQDKIAETIKWQNETLEGRLKGGLKPAAVKAWQSKEPRNLYLAQHLVIGTNFRGTLWVFDTRTRSAKGEMKLTFWNISYGAQKPTFEKFPDLVEWAIKEVDSRVAHIKRKKGLETEQKAAPAERPKPETAGKRAPTKRAPTKSATRKKKS